MKNLIVVVSSFFCLASAVAMPTQAELKKAQPLVAELMAPAMTTFKEAGAKDKAAAAVKVADASSEFAKAAETEAAKFLLLKGSVNFYTRGEAYDQAADALAVLLSEVKDVPPAVVAEIAGKATGRISETKAPRLFALYRKAKLQVRAASEAKTLAQKLRKVKSDALQRRYAEALAVSGDWKAAYAEFAKLSDAKLKAVVEAEASGKAKNAESGEFWWAYKPDLEDAEDLFKAHAAVFYRTALAAGEITGLKKNIVEQRIKEYDVPADGQEAGPRTPAANGLYCVIDLSGGPDAKKYPVSYLNDMPKGGWSDEYKTTKLVLKKIKAGKDPAGFYSLTKDFYVGIFEITQKQWELVMGDCPSYKGFCGAKRPVETVSHIDIRGSGAAVSENSFVGRIQAKTGDVRYDLPSEAQWVYACRAGSSARFANGDERTALEKLAWWKGNSGERTHEVGEKSPNAFGLFDMHGNVWEKCLDDNANLSGNDPEGTIGCVSVSHGGCWGYDDDFASCGVMTRCKRGIDHKYNNFGFRLCLPLAGGAAAQAVAAAPVPAAKVGKAWQEKGNEATLDLGEKYGKLEFVKCPAGDFKQIVDTDGKMVRVQISRPFWIMKKPITARQTSVGPGLGEWEHITRSMTDVLTAHLTNDFEKDLPRGMVVRLPTLAEWEYAFQANTRDRNSPYYNLCKGREGANWKKVTMTQVNAWGMSCFGTWERVLDVYPAEQLVQYGLDRAKHNRDVEGGVWFVSNKIPELESKKDPLSWAEGNDSLVLCRGPVFRSWFFDISRKKDFGALVRLVIGPDLVSEWKAKRGKK